MKWGTEVQYEDSWHIIESDNYHIWKTENNKNNYPRKRSELTYDLTDENWNPSKFVPIQGTNFCFTPINLIGKNINIIWLQDNAPP